MTCQLCADRPAQLRACRARHSRRYRIEAMATASSAHVAPVQALDLYAHLLDLDLGEDRAERCVRAVLELGWRPHTPATQVPEPAPVMVGGTQTDALELLGGAS